LSFINVNAEMSLVIGLVLGLKEILKVSSDQLSLAQLAALVCLKIIFCLMQLD